MGIIAERQSVPVRALVFTRGMSDTHAAQRETIASAVAQRGWSQGPTVRQCGGRGLRAWDAVVRMILRGAGDVVVVDSLDALADGDGAMTAVLRRLVRAGVRLVAVADGIDTGDPVGRDLVGSLLAGAV